MLFGRKTPLRFSTGSTVRNSNVRALLRSADAELRRAYFASHGLALTGAPAKYGLPYEAPSLRGGEVWAGLDSNQRRRKASRFTVCPVWPLRYLPVMGLAVRLFGTTHPAQQRRQRISRAVYIGLHLAVCKRFLGL